MNPYQRLAAELDAARELLARIRDEIIRLEQFDNEGRLIARPGTLPLRLLKNIAW